VFYILTCGSTGSVWLSRALCSHPEIVCFHGVRTLLDASDNDGGEPQAKKFVRDLEHLYRLSLGEKIFGAIHGFGAAEIAPEIAASGGAFLAMLRHPITRLNSLFHREVKINKIDLSCADVYQGLREDEQHVNDSPNNSTADDSFAVHGRKFDELCKNVLAEDAFILTALEEPDIFQYERIIRDPEYFRACFERLAKGCRKAIAISRARWPDARDGTSTAASIGNVSLECTREYVDRVFNIGIVNAKSRGETSPAEIFERWPNRFKAIFAEHLKSQGGQDAADRYARLGYDLPNELVASFKPKGSRAPAAEALTEGENSSDRLLRAIIEMERIAHSDKLSELKQVHHAEREAFVARINELLSMLEAEREAFVAQINELQTTLDAERKALGARFNELQTSRGALGLKNNLIRLSLIFRKLLAARTGSLPR
jgi:hypothetical protein